jgi:hypothetical protein
MHLRSAVDRDQAVRARDLGEERGAAAKIDPSSKVRCGPLLAVVARWRLGIASRDSRAVAQFDSLGAEGLF